MSRSPKEYHGMLDGPFCERLLGSRQLKGQRRDTEGQGESPKGPEPQVREVPRKERSQYEPLFTSPHSRDSDNLTWIERKATRTGEDLETVRCGEQLEDLGTTKPFLVSNELSCRKQMRLVLRNSTGQCWIQQMCIQSIRLWSSIKKYFLQAEMSRMERSQGAGSSSHYSVRALAAFPSNGEAGQGRPHCGWPEQEFQCTSQS